MNNPSEVMGKRIKEKRLALDLTQDELGKLIGVQRAAINKYESGQVENMKRSVIKELSKLFNVDPNWLMAFDIDTSSREEAIDNNAEFFSYRYYPVSISAGALEDIDAIREYDLLALSNKFLGKYAGNNNLIILKVNGESMNNVIPNGSFIAVDTSRKNITDISDRDIVVFSENGSYSVKRYINDRANERFLFKPDSSDDTFTAIEVRYEESTDLRLIGKVVRYIVSLD